MAGRPRASLTHITPTRRPTGHPGVHEVYLKLAQQRQLPAESRAHFFAIAATAMRHRERGHYRDPCCALLKKRIGL